MGIVNQKLKVTLGALPQKIHIRANDEAQPDSVIHVINIMLGWAPAVASSIMVVAAFFIPIEKEFATAKEKLRRLSVR
ncbi:MAG: hypothetical protein LBQ94_03275 [Treponema sp.]|nr:hypothetical protein [Treponema sp.]